MPQAINLNRFDLASLRLFVATVDAGSLTAGAERFGISLAAASKRISDLEAHFGSPLLQRSKRGVVPTPAGMTLQRHAIEVVARLEQLAVAMGDFQRGAGGHLRLWANTSAFGGFLPGLLAAYSTAHLGVKIDLEDALSEDAARAVARGTAELAVIGENTQTDGLQTFVCHSDELICERRFEVC
jgi:DNA-binding transcriptional LysR family regulator